jgi:hypothetical protein
MFFIIGKLFIIKHKNRHKGLINGDNRTENTPTAEKIPDIYFLNFSDKLNEQKEIIRSFCRTITADKAEIGESM